VQKKLRNGKPPEKWAGARNKKKRKNGSKNHFEHSRNGWEKKASTPPTKGHKAKSPSPDGYHKRHHSAASKGKKQPLARGRSTNLWAKILEVASVADHIF